MTASDIDRLLEPGAIVPVDIKTTALLVHEIIRLRAEVKEAWSARNELAVLVGIRPADAD